MFSTFRFLLHVVGSHSGQCRGAHDVPSPVSSMGRTGREVTLQGLGKNLTKYVDQRHVSEP